jgi:hypothetical protein
MRSYILFFVLMGLLKSGIGSSQDVSIKMGIKANVQSEIGRTIPDVDHLPDVGSAEAIGLCTLHLRSVELRYKPNFAVNTTVCYTPALANHLDSLNYRV